MQNLSEMNYRELCSKAASLKIPFIGVKKKVLIAEIQKKSGVSEAPKTESTANEIVNSTINENLKESNKLPSKKEKEIVNLSIERRIGKLFGDKFQYVVKMNGQDIESGNKLSQVYEEYVVPLRNKLKDEGKKVNYVYENPKRNETEKKD